MAEERAGPLSRQQRRLREDGSRLRGDDIGGVAGSRSISSRSSFQTAHANRLCEDTASRSRDALARPRCDHSSHPRNRGRAERRMLNASAAPCAKGKKHTSVVTTNTPKSSGVPHAMGYGLLRALPGDRSLDLSPSSLLRVSASGRRRLSTGLDASVRASGPHDLGRTGSVVRQRISDNSRTLCGESALLPLSAPDAAASITSRPASVTIASRPSVGRDNRNIVICYKMSNKI
jgi:hypothetical protein